jgi:hypothetical protein
MELGQCDTEGFSDGCPLGEVDVLGNSLGIELGHIETDGFSDG